MAYDSLSANPLGVLSRYGAGIAIASPRILRRYLSATQQLLQGSQIELPQPLAGEVQDAFSRLEETLRNAMKRKDSREKKNALSELNRWQKTYRNNLGSDAETQTIQPTAIAVYGGNENKILQNAPLVMDTGYLVGINYWRSRQQREQLPLQVKERLDLFDKTMWMYATFPTEEGFAGIRKAVIEGYMLASLFGVDFLDVYGPQISQAVDRFVQTCLTKTYGHDNSAHAIAESGLGIQGKEALFTTKVNLAKRMIEGFGGSLHYKRGEELTRAVVAYANRSNHDIGALVQQLQSEKDPDTRQRLVDEMTALRESAERVGQRYNIPIPPPRINVQHFQLPRSNGATLTERLGE